MILFDIVLEIILVFQVVSHQHRSPSLAYDTNSLPFGDEGISAVWDVSGDRVFKGEGFEKEKRPLRTLFF